MPLLSWTGPEDAFEAWKECSRGRPCDYTGMSYDRLRGGSGIQWPCNDENPQGRERLYGNGVFPTDPDYCESYGHDLLTGATVGAEAFQARAPDGRALLKTADYHPPHEEPDGQYPFRYTTGRTAYHFHTRTKTGRSRPLTRAAPTAWVELGPDDAERLGIREGDLVRVTSRRGRIEVPARVSDIRRGTVFAPFHYGYWDRDGRAGRTPDGRQRTHAHRVGSGVQTARLQECGGEGGKDWRRRWPRPGADHDGVPSRRGGGLAATDAAYHRRQ